MYLKGTHRKEDSSQIWFKKRKMNDIAGLFAGTKTIKYNNFYPNSD